MFECKRCGHCCHGEATVTLDDQDIGRMSAYLGLPLPELKDKYLRRIGKSFEMKIVDGHCIFYRDRGCRIHPARPWRCGQWPLHPSILIDRSNFQAITSSCPGLETAPEYERFCEMMRELEDPDL